VLETLLLYRIQLLSHVLWHVIVVPQLVAFFLITNQTLELVCQKSVVLLSRDLAPAVGAEIAWWPRAAHELVYLTPHCPLA
jgi:hypothetical protein